MLQNIVVLGGGSAGLIAAITLRMKLPRLNVCVLRSPEIGVIGVGEGTTASFPRHFFEYLKVPPRVFYAGTSPTWKLGIKFLWGPRREFYYSFAKEYEHRWPELSRNVGFYHDDDTHWVGPISAMMAHERAFPRKADGMPQFHNHHAFHIENIRLVGWLEQWAREIGVQVRDANVVHAETGPVRTSGREEKGITALVLDTGERVTADLIVDASGFRSELLGRALEEPYISYSKSLFCDRAVIAGWTRTTETILPYTIAETMNAGWCWQIDHEHWINRGYVYASSFISDEEALAEFRAKNPKLSNEPRIVKFRSGRRARNWVGNVVGVGNSVGFVEPLEATALQVICVEVSTLADALVDSMQAPGPMLVDLYNAFNAQAWDDIRDFLAVHYAFNTRLDTEFWRACRADTDLAGAARIVDWYRENGPSALAKGILIPEQNSFGFEGYLALLTGQKVPHGRVGSHPVDDARLWRARRDAYAVGALKCMPASECLAALRRAGWISAKG